MKTNADFKIIDKMITDKVFSEFTQNEWQEECQSCKNTREKDSDKKNCSNCDGKGFIVYEK